jgi:hypothetical protein
VDITETQEIAVRTTSLAELITVEMQLNLLETKLDAFKEFLQRAELRRGLLIARRSVLRAIFGTATMMDLDMLYSTIDALHGKDDFIAHSYIKR